MYQTLSIVKRNWGFYTFLVLAGGLSLLQVYSVSFLIITILLAAAVSPFVQNAVLMNLSIKDSLKENSRIGQALIPCLFKSCALVLLFIMIGLLLVILFDRAITWNLSPTVYDNPFSEAEIDLQVTRAVAALLTSLIAAALTLSLVGTWLPATLYGQKTSLADAFQRGKAKFFQTIWRLFLALVVWCLMVGITPVINGFLLSEVFGSLNHSAFLVLLLSIIATIFIQMVCLTYVSVVLTNIYKTSEGLELKQE